MKTRRIFLSQTALATAALASNPLKVLGGFSQNINNDFKKNTLNSPADTMMNKLNFPPRSGFGGVAAGNGFQMNSNSKIDKTLQSAWENGVRFFDTSPWYGLGLSERRFGYFLFEQERNDFQISTKIGRILIPDADFTPNPDLLWKGRLNFNYKYDYTAGGVRKSIEDSLHRLGLDSIDYVFVHDLSPDNEDMGEKWIEKFEEARKGAFPELSKMREEGIIKGWGMGVNRPQPILKCMEVADPDIMLVAIQYSLVDHENALNQVFPAMEEKGVKAVIGGPFNSGFLAGKERFNYSSVIPPAMAEKRKKIREVIKKYKVDLATVALQFCAAHPAVASVIPGASTAEQAEDNAKSFTAKIPAGLWEDLKKENLIAKNAPVPN